jgi:hypothetical protein
MRSCDTLSDSSVLRTSSRKDLLDRGSPTSHQFKMAAPGSRSSDLASVKNGAHGSCCWGVAITAARRQQSGDQGGTLLHRRSGMDPIVLLSLLLHRPTCPILPHYSGFSIS